MRARHRKVGVEIMWYSGPRKRLRTYKGNLHTSKCHISTSIPSDPIEMIMLGLLVRLPQLSAYRVWRTSDSCGGSR